MSFWDTLLQVGGNIAGGIFLGDPAAGTQADALITGLTGGPIGGGGGGGATGAANSLATGFAAQKAAAGNADAIQKMTGTAVGSVAPNTANYTNALLNLYSQVKNPATSAAYAPQSLGSTPQISAAQLAPGAGADFLKSNISGGGTNNGAGFQYKAPDYASILAQSSPSTLAAPVPGGAPPAAGVGGMAFAPPANSGPAGAATAGSSANPASTQSINATFQQQFGMTPAQWMAQNPTYYQPNSPTWNSPQMKLLNSQPGYDWLGASASSHSLVPPSIAPPSVSPPSIAPPAPPQIGGIPRQSQSLLAPTPSPLGQRIAA